jgi:DNA-binding transcriptional LysR family regulator
MDARSLQIFLAVAESGSITRAAETLGCSQPHVTRTVQDLEAEIGVPLLLRAGRRIVLSEAGFAFEVEARRMAEAFAGLPERVRQASAGKGPVLRIAATPAIAGTLLSRALARVDPRMLPEVHLAQTAAGGVAHEVRDAIAEIGFSSLPLDVPGVRLLRLYTAPAAAVLHREDPLARKRQLAIEDFAGRRQVTMLDPTRFQRQVQAVFTARGVDGDGYVRTNAASIAVRLVRDLRALALLDPITAASVDLPDLVVRPVDADVPYFWGILADSNRPLRPLAETLVEHFEAEALARIPGIVSVDPASWVNSASTGTAD